MTKPQSPRIVYTIASKDIMDALKSRVILVNLGVLILLLLLIKFAPRLWKPGRMDLTYYDAGDSSLITALSNQEDVRLFEAQSRAALIELLDDGDQGSLGLIIPTDYNQSLDAGNIPVLHGFLLWNRRNTGDA